jgi:hypothetical protein
MKQKTFSRGKGPPLKKFIKCIMHLQEKGAFIEGEKPTTQIMNPYKKVTVYEARKIKRKCS